MRYASQTTVSSDRSRAEIEALLQRYGADQFCYGWTNGSAVIGFRMCSRCVRFTLPMPDKTDERFTRTPGGRRTRSGSDALRAWEQEGRQRWRALKIVILAKLEAVEAGISTFEREFLSAILLPDGQTVGQWMAPALETVYKTGRILDLPELPA